jgi:acyl-homoserine lactone acylase PvdQ
LAKIAAGLNQAIARLMRAVWLLFVLALSQALFATEPNGDAARWQTEAQNVTITRDDWGIAHVHGKTDADAVFGMIYAQAEDDFNRIETNYLNALGRLAEAEGESKIYQDLRMRLFIDPIVLRSQYTTSPEWLQKLMNAFADGLNCYLATHPNVHPRVLNRFEPWMALAFTEGSIGGDIERVDLDQLRAFYARNAGSQNLSEKAAADLAPSAGSDANREPSGSNGIAIAPSNTAGHHALLLINPHTSFFFRSELQMTSDEGLNAYGAVTWGQFFVYQGFNEHAGWMHTSSGADAVDEYLEAVSKSGDHLVYRYGSQERPVAQKEISITYKISGGSADKRFITYATHHGPITGEQRGKWISIRLMQEHVKALMQSYTRTKARDYEEFQQTMELHTNSSNNTIFADAAGNIAYFHGNFIPRRDPRFDWTQPVDGSNPATEWHGLLRVDETPHLLNPSNGWLYNANNWPWSAAGPSSPKKSDFPAYVENGVESARGLHAIRVLEGKKNFTLESLVAAAYDSYLLWFAETIPALIEAWDRTPDSDPLRRKLADQIGELRHGIFVGPCRRFRLRLLCSGVRSCDASCFRERKTRVALWKISSVARPRLWSSSKPWRLHLRSSRSISAPGKHPGEPLTASSGLQATSFNLSTIPSQAYRSVSHPRSGVPLLRSVHGGIPAPGNGMAPAVTALWRSLN